MRKRRRRRRLRLFGRWPYKICLNLIVIHGFLFVFASPTSSFVVRLFGVTFCWILRDHDRWWRCSAKVYNTLIYETTKRFIAIPFFSSATTWSSSTSSSSYTFVRWIVSRRTAGYERWLILAMTLSAECWGIQFRWPLSPPGDANHCIPNEIWDPVLFRVFPRGHSPTVSTLCSLYSTWNTEIFFFVVV